MANRGAGRVCGIVLAASLLASACGGSDDAGGPADDDEPTATPAPAAAELDPTEVPAPTVAPAEPTPTTAEDDPNLTTLAELNERRFPGDSLVFTGDQWVVPVVASRDQETFFIIVFMSPEGETWTQQQLDLGDFAIDAPDYFLTQAGPWTVVYPNQPTLEARVAVSTDLVTWETVAAELPDVPLDDGLFWGTYVRTSAEAQMVTLGHTAFVGEELRRNGIPNRCPVPCRDWIGSGDARVEFTTDLDARHDEVWWFHDDGTYERIEAPRNDVYFYAGTEDRPIIVDYVLQGTVEASVWNGSGWDNTTYEASSNFSSPIGYAGHTYSAITDAGAVTLLVSDDDGQTWTDAGSFPIAEGRIGRIVEFAGVGAGVAMVINSTPETILYAADGVTFEALTTVEAGSNGRGVTALDVGDGRLAFVADRTLTFVDLPG